jgi:hypothetical protein
MVRSGARTLGLPVHTVRVRDFLQLEWAEGNARELPVVLRTCE